MIVIRRGSERGRADHGWLNSFHTFSFGSYADSRFMGFSNLRVLNEDRVQGGQGFGSHGHSDMEIVSYVISGALGHQDSIGTGSTIVPGDVQRMTAGTGIRHSESNHNATDIVHFLQIWLLPKARGLEPSYAQKSFTASDKRGRFCTVASPDGRDNSIVLHADAVMFASLLGRGERAGVALPTSRGFVHVVSGSAIVNGAALDAGDAVMLDGETNIDAVCAADGIADVLAWSLA